MNAAKFELLEDQAPVSTRSSMIAHMGATGDSERIGLTSAFAAQSPLGYRIGRFLDRRAGEEETRARGSEGRFRSWRSLTEFVESLSSAIEVGSFDFFDTLASRGRLVPERVIRRSCEHLALLLNREGCPVSPAYVLRVRQAVEKRERENGIRVRLLDPETSLADIVRGVCVAIRGGDVDEATIERAIAYEIALELSVLGPTRDALQALALAQKSGRRVFVTSEMYIHHEHLSDICRSLGFSPYIEEIIISSRVGFMKGSGRIYEYLAELTAVAPSHIAHIGDNLRADVYPALSAGLEAHYFNVEEERANLQRFEASIEAFERGDASAKMTKHILSSFDLMPSNWRSDSDSPLEVLATEVVAPSASVFTHWATQEVLRHDIEAVFFLAREGVIFHELFEVFRKTSPEFASCLEDVPYKILYMSRTAALALECPRQWDPSEFVRITMSRTGDLGLDSTLGAWGLNRDDLSLHAQQEFEGLTQNYPRRHYHESLRAMLQNSHAFSQEVFALLKTKRELAIQYLQQNGVFDYSRVGMVDLGWVGTISKCISYAAVEEGVDLSITSFLFATSPAHFNEQGIDLAKLSSPPGCIIDGGRDPFSFQRMTDAAAVLEVVFGEDRMGSALSYEKRAGQIVPVFGDTPVSAHNAAIQEEIRGALTRAIGAYAVAIDRSCLGLDSLLSEYRNILFRFLQAPKRAEVMLLADCRLDLGLTAADMEPPPLVAKLEFRNILSADFLTSAGPYVWRRGSFAYSRFPAWVTKLYETVFLIQSTFPRAHQQLRRWIKWDPFIWR